MPRTNSSNWAVNDQITAARLQDLNEDVDDLYSKGNDRLRVYAAVSGTALRIDIGTGNYNVEGSEGTYAGTTDAVVTNAATNYVQINSSGTIVINTTGYVVGNVKLATVVCAGGAITSITLTKNDAVGGRMSGTPTTLLYPKDGTPSTIWPCASAAITYGTYGAIAFDAKADPSGGVASSNTFAHTCTGSNRILIVGILAFGSTSDVVSSVTYNGVAMTRLRMTTNNQGGAGSTSMYIYYLVAPATGANNVVVTYTGSVDQYCRSCSYTGVNQDRPWDFSAETVNTSGVTTHTLSATTISDGTWTVGWSHASGGSQSVTVGTARTGGTTTYLIADTNAAKTPPGSAPITSTFSSGYATIMGGVLIPVRTSQTITTFDFDASSREAAEFTVVVPETYTGGTVEARFYWTATNTGDVIWGIAGRAHADGDDAVNDYGTAQEVTDTIGTAGDRMTSAQTSAITLAGTPAASSLVSFLVYRKADHASDTLAVDAKLIAVEISFT